MGRWTFGGSVVRRPRLYVSRLLLGLRTRRSVVNWNRGLEGRTLIDSISRLSSGVLCDTPVVRHIWWVSHGWSGGEGNSVRTNNLYIVQKPTPCNSRKLTKSNLIFHRTNFVNQFYESTTQRTFFFFFFRAFQSPGCSCSNVKQIVFERGGFVFFTVGKCLRQNNH